MKLTGWYSGDQKPVRKGVYQRLVSGDLMYAYWDGQEWISGCSKENGAPIRRAKRCRESGFYSSKQRLPWRGIAK